jgi:hypothetical protein
MNNKFHGTLLLEKKIIAQLVKKFSFLCLVTLFEIGLILSQISPVRILKSSLIKIHFNILHPSITRSPKSGLPIRYTDKVYMHLSSGL